MSKNRAEQQGAKSKKWWIVGAVVVLLIIGAAMGGNNRGQTPDPAGSQQTEQQDTEPSSEHTAEPVEPEANTSAKVDALAREAKAVVAEGVTDGKRDEAVGFIVEHYPDYYTDNATMEQAMAYGFWLEYAYTGNEAARDYAELGIDVTQSVKYVYRGAEKVEDDATQENLRQVKERLETLGHSVE